MLVAGDVPYYIGTDMNIDPAKSEILKRAMDCGLVIDVPAQFAHGNQPTYDRDGQKEGRIGPGRTRIDTILANKAGAAMVKTCKLRWDLTPVDHVPIEITLNMKAFNATATVANVPSPFPLDAYRELLTKGGKEVEIQKKKCSDL